MSAPRLAVVECRGCGKAWWTEAWIAEAADGVIDGGPCCFGHEVLRVERYGCERVARKAWPALEANELRAIKREGGVR